MSSNSSSAGADNVGGMLSSMNRVGLGYGIAIAVGMMMFLCTMMLVCARLHAGRASSSTRRRATPYTEGTVVVIHQEPLSNVTGGLDEVTLASYPKFLYSEKESLPTHVKDSSCPICLGDYGDGDTLRLLPDCGHVFHVHCIDAWLHLHISCPICRSSPLPTPISTPLSELIPLARNPLG